MTRFQKILKLKSKQVKSLLSLVLALLVFSCMAHEAHAATYSSSGTITSINLLSGLGVKTIDKFGYNISSLPAGTSIKVQFSQDSVTWGSWNTLSSGDHTAEGDAIDLSSLNWRGGNFYYQTEFDTTDPAATALLDDIVVYYSPGVYLTTQTASVVYPSGATANGNIVGIADGNATVRGFKYGLTQADTWDVHENGSYGTGTYALNITSLSPNTTYYVRAYATNPDGTSYGDYTSFTTGTYASSGTITSTNLLLGQTITSIDEFDYTLSAKPEGTSTTIQFSQNGTTWYNSSATLNGTDILITGANPINLSKLAWTGANFYYKIALTANAAGSTTPVLDDVNVVTNSNAPATVVEYRLDEGSGSIAHNTGSGGSVLNGNITSGTWNNSGKFSKALQFNGTSSVITIATPITGIRTVSFWINTPSTTAKLIDFDGGIHTVIATAGVVSTTGFTVTPIIYVNGVRGASLAANSWQHILITTTYASAFDSTTITLGKIGTNYFSGSMDEVKIFNYSMNPSQVKVDFNQGFVSSLGNNNTPKGNPAVIFYRFDEGSGNTANNSGSGGAALAGVITSGTWNSSGKFGKALTFTASTSVVRTLSTDPEASNALSFWVYPTTSAASKTLVTNLTTDANSKPVYGNCTGIALALNTWTHLIVQSDGSGSCKIFQNGVLTATGTTGVTFGTTFNIGSTSFVGSIDEFKFYYYPLTVDEIKVAYNQGLALSLGSSSTGYCPSGTTCVGPIAEWNFDEGSGTTANDTSGNGNTGTLNNSPVWTTGKSGKTLQFNGSSQSITATLGANPAYANTLEAWVYPTGSMVSKTIITNLTTNSSSQPVYGGCTGTALPLNQWSYISAVSTDSTHCTLYQNTIPVTGGTGVTYGTTVNIGNSSFTGKIDAVRIYNYARTQAQIAWDYNRGKPVGQWRLDEGLGTTLHDNISATNSATLTGGTWGTGKMSSAVQFNGVSDKATVATGLNYIQSISFWAKPTSTSQSFLQLNAGQYISATAGVVSATGFSVPSIYVNGKLNGTITANVWNLVTVVTPTSLSASVIKFGIQNSTYYSGWLDDIQIFNYPLNSDQAKILFNDNMGVTY